jgi:YD repeat-containing protein
VAYPDGSHEYYNVVDYQGDVITYVGRNTAQHNYTYDAAGRELSDTASNPSNASIGGNVDQLDYTYNALGQVTLVTSNGSNGTVTENQVQETYNEFGQLASDAQSHSGAVTAGTPTVQYGYTSAATGDLLSSETYPTSSRVINYGYGEGVNAELGRIATVSDGSTLLESYTYLGTGTVVGLNRNQSGETLSVALDEYGRVSEQQWNNSTGTIADDVYSYDSDGDLISDDNLTLPTLSTMYVDPAGDSVEADSVYTPLGEPQQFERGTLTSSTEIGSPIPQSTEVFQQDTQGNYTAITEGGNPQTGTVAYTASNAVANSNGNSSLGGDTTSLGTNTFGNPVTATYDAWGRLVSTQVTFTDGVYGTQNYSTSTYSYDALGRQITLSENVTTGNLTDSYSLDLYYDASGNVIEERSSGNIIASPMAAAIWRSSPFARCAVIPNP